MNRQKTKFAGLGMLLSALLFAAGCGESSRPSASAGVGPPEPTQAQPRLQTIKLYIGPTELLAELALTPEQQRIGMMFRTNLPENLGMLFPLPYTQRAGFWMKNCPSPLSLAYIDPEGIIQEIRELRPFDTNSVVAASDNIRFVLETPKGWFERNRIRPGAAVTTERGPLMKTFFGANSR